jgi:uncharacterized protein (TIGR03435 family)
MRWPLPIRTILPAVALCAALPLGAQLILAKPGETVPRFEVATVRASPEGGHMMRIEWMPDSFHCDNVTLRAIVRVAYGTASDEQVIGGPDALLNTHFDISAKMDGAEAAVVKNLSRDDQRRHNALMLQALLADRFGLKVHSETRELPVYALVVAKSGSKLKATAPDPPAPAPDPDAPPPDALAKPDPTAPPRVGKGMMMIRMSSDKVEMTANGTTLDALANMLTGQPDAGGRVIVDKTGLTGKYDIHLSWTPTTNMGMKGMDNGTDAAANLADAPGLFTALEEQLGLKLDSTKGPVPVVLVDHLEAPSAN